MKIPKFKTEAEEADWYYRNRDKIKWGKPVRDADGNLMTPAQIVAAEIDKRKRTQPITIRLSVADIELAKTLAEQKGLAYQTYLKSLVHQALTSK
jgi:predicted DNA binding CopG/RHH family protein